MNKRYKLLKDLPYFKVGDIFTLGSTGNAIRESDGALTDYMCSELPEWFEELVEEKRWKPKSGQMFWYVDYNIEASESEFNTKFSTYKKVLDSNNYFRFKVEAEATANAFKAVLNHIQSPIGESECDFHKAIEDARMLVQRGDEG